MIKFICTHAVLMHVYIRTCIYKHNIHMYTQNYVYTCLYECIYVDICVCILYSTIMIILVNRLISKDIGFKSKDTRKYW